MNAAISAIKMTIPIRYNVPYYIHRVEKNSLSPR